MKKKYPYLRRIIAGIIALLLLLAASAVIYLTANRDSIIAQVKKDISEKVNGKLEIGEVELSFFKNFPHASVLLHNVKLTDTMYSSHGHTFFEAREVFATISIPRLIKKQSPVKGIRIDNGSFFSYTAADGYSNKYLLQGKNEPGKKKTEENILKTIEINGLKITIRDDRKSKMHSFIANKARLKISGDRDLISVKTKLNISVDSLSFNTRKGNYLKGKKVDGNFTFSYNPGQKKLLFDSIPLKISGQPFRFTGLFDDLNKTFSLVINTHDVPYSFVRDIIPVKISKSLGIVNIDGLQKVRAEISGPLGGGEPFLSITGNVVKSILTTPFMDFEKASFNASFTNEVSKGLPRDDSNSMIRMWDFTALWHGLPVSSQELSILNLTTPILTCDLSSDFRLKELNTLLSSNSLDLQNGNATVRLSYKGPVERNDETNSFINGHITVKDGSLKYKPRDVEMKNVNGRIAFRDSDIYIEDLKANVFGQQFVMKGYGRKLLTLAMLAPAEALINWDIYTPSLDLSRIMYLLKSRGGNSQTASENGITGMAGKVDKIVEEGRLQVKLHTPRLTYKKFTATNFDADVMLLQDRYVLNHVRMNHAGGSFGVKGTLVNVAGNRHQAAVNIDMNNVDVSEVFSSFENFGQDGITAESISGKLTTTANASLMLDSEGKVIPSSVASIIDFSLKEGSLNNYEPVKKLQRFVFKNRDFENIRFAELKNRLEVKDREVKINRMEIQSTVLWMYVEGIFSQKGNTDLSIQVPLSNLKKRAEDFNPENFGLNKKTGSNIFIRGRPGPDGNIKFKLDLFNKFDKAGKTK